MSEIVKEFSVKKYGHTFSFTVVDSGRVEYRIDNGDTFTAKKLEDGKVFFIKKQEIIFKNELLLLESLELDEADFTALKESLDAVLKQKQEQSLHKLNVGRTEAMRFVDSWTRKVRTYKDENKIKQKYCIHQFRIGNDKYRFVERKFPDVGILINPDYKISIDVPSVGGVPKKYGELMFWDYLFPEKGWQRVRVISYNERICLNIIENYGYFALPEEKEFPKKKGLFGNSKKKVS